MAGTGKAREVKRPQPGKKEADTGTDMPVDAPPDEPQIERHELTPALRKLKLQIAELYGSVGLMIAPVERLGGSLLAVSAEDLADDWVRLAESDKEVRRILEKIVSAGGWGGVFMGHAVIVLAVLVNRGAGPDQVAAGVAAMTVLQHPDLAPLFTHERFTGPDEPGRPENCYVA